MHSSSSRQANMNKENANTANQEEPTVRITRSRAKAMGMLGGCHPAPNAHSKQDQKHVVGAKTKRAESDDSKAAVCANAGIQHKRRAVLKDVTNICGGNSHPNCVNAVKVGGKQASKSLAKNNAEVAIDIFMEISPVEEDMKTKLVEELSKIRMVEPQDTASPPNLEAKRHSLHHNTGEGSLADHRVARSVDLMEPARLLTIKKEVDRICKKMESSSVVDIDSNLSDPQVCSLYAPDIYNNIRVTELGHRPSNNYMEVVQRDITPSMRGILIDWLVEVSEEYTLVPDTLYLTVNLIDRFLSQNYMEKQRLQLLGVSCMLIASKYEEICAPRVEEFCFITDNTYTKGEVLKMESRVLNFMYFQLSVPTTKTFLRRYIQAAQASDKVPCVELEFLANYLAELTLIDHNFLKFLPSLIAASAVFLARWTLSQSDHPWNPTLEHYTSYKVSEMKVTVLALEDLQLNTNGCTLNAIREKYRQPKFKCVASLTPPQRVSTIF